MSEAKRQDFFEGHKDRECGEHRTVGYRAWCFDCHEWCYPRVALACKGCELPALKAELGIVRMMASSLWDDDGTDAYAEAIIWLRNWSIKEESHNQEPTASGEGQSG